MSARNVLYLDLGDVFMNVFICKSSLSRILQIRTLTCVKYYYSRVLKCFKNRRNYFNLLSVCLGGVVQSAKLHCRLLVP